MAREKTWVCRQNINVSDTDDATTAKKWMYEFYNFLSGGVGNSDAKWEILSASQGSGSVGGGGLLSSSHQFNWGTGHRSWFVCRKNILPVTASAQRYIYLTVDLDQSNDHDATFLWDYEEPNFGSQATNSRPTNSGEVYSKTSQFRLDYDAGNDTYFHGTIDTTGSFYVVGSQANGTTNHPYASSICCARVETARHPTVDPFPIFLKVAFDDSNARHGAWGGGDNGSPAYNTNSTYADPNNTGTPSPLWTSTGGQAMWSPAGIAINASSNNGQNAGFLMYATLDGINNSPAGDTPSTGEALDGTFPLLPAFIYNPYSSPTSNSIVRGRLPDIFPGSYIDSTFGFGGLTTPATGTPEYCVVGDWWLPFSASLLPGAS
jgi:hypothetical protein